MPSTSLPRFSPDRTVASIVTEAPRTARVFERYGIDYCCGGRVPLAEACAAKGLAPEAVLTDLEAAVASGGPEVDWSQESPTAVIDHVLEVHHTYVKREIPRLRALAEKVSRVHGERHPELPKMARIWDGVATELEQHLEKEEQVLFPMVRMLARSRAGTPRFALEGPLSVMEAEHESAGEGMARLRELAGGYVVPADACNSFRALWSGLDEFERDLHVHVHLENEVLFRKVRDLAAASG